MNQRGGICGTANIAIIYMRIWRENSVERIPSRELIAQECFATNSCTYNQSDIRCRLNVI